MQRFGPTGMRGDTGPTGIQGLQGPRGFFGQQGLPGLQGFTGIIGFTGLAGPTGETGSTGFQGIKGDTGPTGIKGITGPTGSPGSINNITSENGLVLFNNTVLWRLKNYPDDITAKNNGVPIFGLYRTNDIIKIRLNDVPPVLTLNGSTGYTIDNNTIFTDPGVIGLDYSNTNIPVYLYNILNSTNNNILISPLLINTTNTNINITNTLSNDTYTLKYYGLDDCGNTGYINRTLNIYGVIGASIFFNSSRSLRWVPTQTGNSQNWTLSMWFYTSDSGNIVQNLFSFGSTSASGSTPGYIAIDIRSDVGQTRSICIGGGGDPGYGSLVSTPANSVIANQWNHLVVSGDMSLSDQTKRIKMYLNGVEQNMLLAVNYNPHYPSPTESIIRNINTAGNTISIGNHLVLLDRYIRGYISNTYWVDGTTLLPSNFGKISNGSWVAKSYFGNLGTNGFYLNFLGANPYGNFTTTTNLPSIVTNMLPPGISAS